MLSPNREECAAAGRSATAGLCGCLTSTLSVASITLCAQSIKASTFSFMDTVAAAGLSDRVTRMLASIEKELDAVESKIGTSMHVLDKDQDGACKHLFRSENKFAWLPCSDILAWNKSHRQLESRVTAEHTSQHFFKHIQVAVDSHTCNKVAGSVGHEHECSVHVHAGVISVDEVQKAVSCLRDQLSPEDLNALLCKLGAAAQGHDIKGHVHCGAFGAWLADVQAGGCSTAPQQEVSELLSLASKKEEEEEEARKKSERKNKLCSQGLLRFKCLSMSRVSAPYLLLCAFCWNPPPLELLHYPLGEDADSNAYFFKSQAD
eukprot:1158834-Pelagomonas_calceolata.AAC.2